MVFCTVVDGEDDCVVLEGLAWLVGPVEHMILIQWKFQ